MILRLLREQKKAGGWRIWKQGLFWIRYFPTKDAFIRGGYEITFGPPSHMAPETGDMLADSAAKLIQNMQLSVS